MDYLQLTKVVLVFVAFSQAHITNASMEPTYEPVKNVCQQCTCLSQLNDDATDSHIKHYILSCSTKNFHHILPKWPDEFGTNHTGAEIIASFSGNAIKILQQLPESEAIISLSCRHCELTEIASAAFIDTANILRLDLSWNKLTGEALHPDVFRGRFDDKEYDPIGLEDLDLSHNEIDSLDSKSFEHLPHLNRINLANNKLTLTDKATQVAIGSLINIEFLDLSYNNLKVLPSDMLKNLVNIKEISLQGNQYTKVPTSLSLVGESLEILSLGANPIEDLHEGSFLGMKTLSFLNISSMPELNSINVGTFAPLLVLEVLLCRNNSNLKKFDLGSLLKNKNLKELDLSACNLNELNTDYAEDRKVSNNTMQWSKLRLLKLSSNPWHCDCFLMDIVKDFIHSGNEEFYEDSDTRCSTPYDLSGSLFRELSYEEICQPPIPRKQLKIPIHESPSFLRPRSIALSLISVTFVTIFGVIIGYFIVFIKKKLKKNNFGLVAPIRYTTVRNSTTSVE